VSAQNRKSSRRKGQTMVRTVFVLAGAAASILAYLLSAANGLGAIIPPGIVMGLVVIGVSLHCRARSRQEWRAAWDAYSEREIYRGSFDPIPDGATCSCGYTK
jgi:hypothetical protein